MTSRSDPADYFPPPPAGMFEVASEEEQEWLTTLAAEFIQQLEDCERAMAVKFDAQLFDLEEGNALWSLLPSKVRTAIKRGKQ